jgi:hypothetical protein
MSNLVLRNPEQAPLSIEQLRKFSPAIFAKEAHEDVSDKYGFMPTFKVLEHMHKAGFVPVEARNYQRRDPTAFKFTKHMLRFRQAGKLETRKVGDIVPQTVLINSHDRTSRWELYGGLYRLICANGLLVSESSAVVPVKLRHTLHLAETVVETSMKLIAQHKHVFEHIKVMQGTKLSDRQQAGFARTALALRPTRGGVINAVDLLKPRRAQDEGDDLWHVFNRVQENLLKGGIEGITAAGRHIRTQEIRAIGADVDLNAGLWELAMAAISKASTSSKRVIEGKVTRREVVPA